MKTVFQNSPTQHRNLLKPPLNSLNTQRKAEIGAVIRLNLREFLGYKKQQLLVDKRQIWKLSGIKTNSGIRSKAISRCSHQVQVAKLPASRKWTTILSSSSRWANVNREITIMKEPWPNRQNSFAQQLIVRPRWLCPTVQAQVSGSKSSSVGLILPKKLWYRLGKLSVHLKWVYQLKRQHQRNRARPRCSSHHQPQGQSFTSRIHLESRLKDRRRKCSC